MCRKSTSRASKLRTASRNFAVQTGLNKYAVRSVAGASCVSIVRLSKQVRLNHQGREDGESVMHINFYCPNGHKIKAKSELSGQTGKCPKCSARILVPETAAEKLPNPRNNITESGVMRALGDFHPLPNPPATTSPAEVRSCPRCRKTLRGSVTICNHCKLYVGVQSTPKPTVSPSRN